MGRASAWPTLEVASGGNDGRILVFWPLWVSSDLSYWKRLVENSLGRETFQVESLLTAGPALRVYPRFPPASLCGLPLGQQYLGAADSVCVSNPLYRFQ